MTTSAWPRRRKATTGSGLLVLARATGNLLLVTASFAMARTLGPSKYGLLATAIGIAGTLFILNVVGIDQLFLRKELGDVQFRRYVAVVAGVSILVVVVAAFAWPNLVSTTRLLLVLWGVGLALALFAQPWLLRPQRDLLFASRARREIVLRLITASTIIAVAVGTRSPSWVALSMLLAAAIPSSVLVFRPHPNDAVVSSLGLGRALGRGIGYATSGALYSLYMSIDIALVGTLVGSTQAGYYGIASGFLTAAATFPIVMNNDVLRTRLYRCRDASDMMHAAAIRRRFLVLTLAAGTAVSVLMLALAHPVVELLFGPAYGTHVARLVVLLALAVPPNYFNSWAANVLIAGDDVRLVVGVQAAMTVLNVSVNVVLLPATACRRRRGSPSSPKRPGSCSSSISSSPGACEPGQPPLEPSPSAPPRQGVRHERERRHVRIKVVEGVAGTTYPECPTPAGEVRERPNRTHC